MIYSDKCQHSIVERGGYICVLGAVEHCSDPSFRMEALTPSAAGSMMADFLQLSTPSLVTELGWSHFAQCAAFACI